MARDALDCRGIAVLAQNAELALHTEREAELDVLLRVCVLCVLCVLLSLCVLRVCCASVRVCCVRFWTCMPVCACVCADVEEKRPWRWLAENPPCMGNKRTGKQYSLSSSLSWSVLSYVVMNLSERPVDVAGRQAVRQPVSQWVRKSVSQSVSQACRQALRQNGRQIDG